MRDRNVVLLCGSASDVSYVESEVEKARKNRSFLCFLLSFLSVMMNDGKFNGLARRDVAPGDCENRSGI
jgi:hypothetical protein